MYKKIQAIYDGTSFIPQEPIPVSECYEVSITFFEPLNVSLLPHDNDWAKQYVIVKEELNSILGDNLVETYHVGSTAIKNIYSKPILDVAVAVKNIQSLNVVGMEMAGYYYCGERNPGRYAFGKHQQYGSISLLHIHCYQENDDNLMSQVLFCRYLNEHPEYASEYNKIKLDLAAKHSNNRWSYASGKSEFINTVIKLAKKKYT